MGFKVTLINPPLVYRSGDLYGSIPFMPTGLLYLAGYLRSQGVDISILDGFGSAPRNFYRIGKLTGNGLKEEEIVDRIGNEQLVGISVHSGMSHSLALRLAAAIRKKCPSITLVAGGSHASVLYKEFLQGGFDYVCVGEGENSFFALIRFLRDKSGSLNQIPGLAYRGSKAPVCNFEKDLDRFSFGALNMLPLENYWRLGAQHAPVKGRSMVVTTSRGCVYNCRFCTTPQLLGREWRTRSPKHIVDEIQTAVKEHGIEDIIVQDELFGFSNKAAVGFARELIERKLAVRFSLPSGVKVENLDEGTLLLLRQAGLHYLVFAPESGSRRMLEKMSKPMDYARLFRLASFARKLGIKLGCFFIIGFTGEEEEDRRLTRELVVKLTKLGVDEVSLFIWSPLPGADAFEGEKGWSDYEDLNWSPAWRENYGALNDFRNRLHARWLATKILYHPFGVIRMAWNILTGRFELKSEMAVRRFLRSGRIG